MGEDPKAERGTDARTLPTVTQKRRCFGLPGFVYDCNIWYRRFWKSFVNFKEKKRSPASDFKMLWTGDYPLESMGITWHKTIPSARRTRASLYWALPRFLSQPTGKSAIPQATSAIIMNISNIQLSSHHYSIAQEPPSPLIPPQVTGSDTAILGDATPHGTTASLCSHSLATRLCSLLTGEDELVSNRRAASAFLLSGKKRASFPDKKLQKTYFKM